MWRAFRLQRRIVFLNMPRLPWNISKYISSFRKRSHEKVAPYNIQTAQADMSAILREGVLGAPEANASCVKMTSVDVK